MIDDDFDRQEVDRLVRELTARKPLVVPPPAMPTPAAPPPAALEAAPEPPPERPVRTISRWSTVRILMPALAAARPRRTFASAISLPSLALPNLAALRLPALTDETWRVRIVHGWVILGLLLSVSMAYWPYPKTYLLGLLLYLFAVALVVVAGVWSAKLTWDQHLGGAHTVALGIVLWAIVLVAAETLQAVGGV